MSYILATSKNKRLFSVFFHDPLLSADKGDLRSNDLPAFNTLRAFKATLRVVLETSHDPMSELGRPTGMFSAAVQLQPVFAQCIQKYTLLSSKCYSI
jgi:hypothetical protein